MSISGVRVTARSPRLMRERKKIEMQGFSSPAGLAQGRRRLQPFNHGQRAPKQPLAILDELWNTDKHRRLHLTFYFVDLQDVIVEREGIHFIVLEKEADRSFNGRTEHRRIRDVNPGTLTPDMPMHHRLRFDIAFKQGPPAYGAKVIQMLESLHDMMMAIIVKFEPEFT
jgi:hypothetical protein